MTPPSQRTTLSRAPEVSPCRVCGSLDVFSVLDLGSVALANSFVLPEETEPQPEYRLAVQSCRTCAIAQLTWTVDPAVLFRHYLYTPSASTTWRQHCRELSAWIRDRTSGRPDAFVVEPASNDGCLLKEIRPWAAQILGVEPAVNIAQLANDEGVPTVAHFFSLETAAEIRAASRPADVIVGTNVLAHVPDMVDFLRGAARLLADDGELVIEAPYLRDMVESLSFDTIYHEHVSYLSVTALVNAFRIAGLTLVHAERLAIHGGSLRFVGRLAGHAPDDSVRLLLEEEAHLGYDDGSALGEFGSRVTDLRGRIARAVHDVAERGLKVAAYGATAKGNTLLASTGLTADDVLYIIDKNPLKQGRLAPGSRIPVVGPDHLDRHPVDVLLVLAWNLKDEIIAEQSAFAARGGRFLIPIPDPTLV
jgi:C-methyltransferase C-terminal domain/Methyltransferase domain/Putative zinc binding domain